jgi:hypothetical protein
VNISLYLSLIAPDQQLYARNGIDRVKQNVKPVDYPIFKTRPVALTGCLMAYWPDKDVR